MTRWWGGGFRLSKGWLKILPRTLYWRTFLIIALPLILVQMVTAYVVYDRHIGYGTKFSAQMVATILGVVSNAAQKDPYGARNLARNFGLDYTFYIHQAFPYHQPRRSYPSPGELPWVERQLDIALHKTLSMPYVIIPMVGVDKSVPLHDDPLTTIIDDIIIVQVKVPTGVAVFTFPHKWLFSRTTPLVYMGTIGSTVVFMILALIFMRNQMRPIRRLAIAAERFGRGQTLKNFRPEGALEVRRAAQSFIDMQARITRYLQQRTEMLAAISHDLRTPLTRLKLQIGLLTCTQDPGTLASEKMALLEDVNQMERLIQEYLDFVKGEGEEKSKTINLGTFLMDAIRPFDRAYPGVIEVSKAVLQAQNDGSLIFTTKPFALKRVLSNLIQNALTYGTKIALGLEQRLEGGAREFSVVIEDNGPGVPASELKNILHPFYRLDKARSIQQNGHQGGAGLGLTIAQDILTRLGGRLELSCPSSLGGLRVVCTLPMTNSREKDAS